MVGIAENDLRVHVFQRILRNAFHRRLRAYGHEYRGFNVAVRGGESACPSGAGLDLYVEGKSHWSYVN